MALICDSGLPAVRSSGALDLPEWVAARPLSLEEPDERGGLPAAVVLRVLLPRDTEEARSIAPLRSCPGARFSDVSRLCAGPSHVGLR